MYAVQFMHQGQHLGRHCAPPRVTVTNRCESKNCMFDRLFPFQGKDISKAGPGKQQVKAAKPQKPKAASGQIHLHLIKQLLSVAMHGVLNCLHSRNQSHRFVVFDSFQ